MTAERVTDTGLAAPGMTSQGMTTQGMTTQGMTTQEMTTGTSVSFGPGPLVVPGGVEDGAPSVDDLLADRRFVRMVRWVFTARLVCLALAAPAALLGPQATGVASLSLCLLTVSSLAFSRSDAVIRTLLKHPLLASLDVAVTVTLLVSIDSGQPAALTAVCSALVAGLLFPRRVLVALMVPLTIGSFGAPASLIGAVPASWTGWLALVAGLPAVVVGVCIVGAVMRRSVEALIEARHEVAEAVAAVGAADERARLARDMHDSVGKSLHGISLGAKALRRVVHRDPALAEDLANSLADAADQAALEARALLMSLREGQDDRPTVEVVGEVLRTWEKETGVVTRLTAVQAVDAAPPVTHQMQAALSEILHNVAKHARATLVEVELTGTTELIELHVTDDGVGFDPGGQAGREAAGHFGLRGLRERARQVGGDADITSSKGEGTQVRWTAQRHPASI